MRVGRKQDDLADRFWIVKARRQRQKCSDLGQADACFQLTAEGRRQRGKILGRQLFGLLTDREQHLLLALRSPEVALQVAMPGPHVLHGANPIEMLRPAEDSDTTAIARCCQRRLIAPVVSPSFLNSYVAPMALISAIHVACAHLDPKRSLTRLKPTDREYLSGERWYREPKET